MKKTNIMKKEEEIELYAEELDKKIEKLYNSILYMEENNFSKEMINNVREERKRCIHEFEALLWVLGY